jgi:hypothetical protein
MAGRISLCVHHIVGMLIHDPVFIKQIETLQQDGATKDQLLAAFNLRRGLPKAPI